MVEKSENAIAGAGSSDAAAAEHGKKPGLAEKFLLAAAGVAGVAALALAGLAANDLLAWWLPEEAAMAVWSWAGVLTVSGIAMFGMSCLVSDWNRMAAVSAAWNVFLVLSAFVSMLGVIAGSVSFMDMQAGRIQAPPHSESAGASGVRFVSSSVSVYSIGSAGGKADDMWMQVKVCGKSAQAGVFVETVCGSSRRSLVSAGDMKAALALMKTGAVMKIVSGSGGSGVVSVSGDASWVKSLASRKDVMLFAEWLSGAPEAAEAFAAAERLAAEEIKNKAGW